MRAFDRVRETGQREPQLVDPFASARAHSHDLGAGHELAGLLLREADGLLVHRIDLRERDHAALDLEQAQDREVLARLRARPLAGVDHEQERVDPRRAGDHRLDETLVAGHVDDGQLPPVRKLERRVAELDRDPAPLLLGQAIGVLSGQGSHEPRLPVVDVARGPDRQRHRSASRALDGARDLVGLCVRQGPAVEQRSTVPHERDDRGLASPEALGELLLDGARSARELGEWKRAAPDARDRLLDLSADACGQPLRASANGLERLVEHPEHRDLGTPSTRPRLPASLRAPRA